MITYATGDILKADAEALVNTVNAVGVMGRGIALQFKEAFPANFRAYAKACERGHVVPGRMFVFETGELTPPRYIINFPTKRHWRGKSRMEDIEVGLVALVEEIRARGIRSIAVPPLGSGLGGLDWQAVRPRIEAAMAGLSGVQVTVFEPLTNATPVAAGSTGRIPEMTPGRAALVGLVERYLAGLLDPFVTLLEVHKLMYLMQEAGEPLRLRFVAATYGPYAQNLRHVLRKVEGYYLSGYAGGDAPDQQLSLVPKAVDDARAFLAVHEETRTRFHRVAELVEGFESPFGLELLSTVHWVAIRDHAATRADIARQVYAWGAAKQKFTERQIGIAMDVLQQQGWIPLGE